MHEARQGAGTKKNANTAFLVKALTSDVELTFPKEGESELPWDDLFGAYTRTLA